MGHVAARGFAPGDIEQNTKWLGFRMLTEQIDQDFSDGLSFLFVNEISLPSVMSGFSQI
jgi:hypothetical protein